MQQQIGEAGVTAFQVVGEAPVAGEPVGRGQLVQYDLGDVQARREVAGASQSPDRALHRVDAGAAEGTVEHQAHAAVIPQSFGQRQQALGRVGQVVQYAATVDVVEAAEIEHVDGQQGTQVEGDVGEATRLGPGLGGLEAGARDVEVDHLAFSPLGQVLGQHDSAITGAAARHQGADRPGAPAGEDEMLDFQQVARRAGDEAPGLVRRVAGGIGQFLVLAANRPGGGARVLLLSQRF